MKVGDKVRIVADAERLKKCGIVSMPLTGKLGVIITFNLGGTLPYLVDISDGHTDDIADDIWWLAEQDLELVEAEQPTSHAGGPLGAKTATGSIRTFSSGADKIRKFESGATRDTAQDKLDYVKALSPIVLRRYVEYLNEHRLQPDGSYREFDNWKNGIPQDVYLSSLGRHNMDVWLLMHGYKTSDNHGPVDIESALCGIIFNSEGLLHEILEERLKEDGDYDAAIDHEIGRTKPIPGGY